MGLFNPAGALSGFGGFQGIMPINNPFSAGAFSGGGGYAAGQLGNLPPGFQNIGQTTYSNLNQTNVFLPNVPNQNFSQGVVGNLTRNPIVQASAPYLTSGPNREWAHMAFDYSGQRGDMGTAGYSGLGMGIQMPNNFGNTMGGGGFAPTEYIGMGQGTNGFGGTQYNTNPYGNGGYGGTALNSQRMIY